MDPTPSRASALVLFLAATALPAQRLIVDLNRTPAAPGSSFPQELTPTSTGTWFTATTSQLGRELWHIDLSGVVHLAADLRVGIEGSDPQWIAGFGTGVLFAADRGAGRHLFHLPGLGQPVRQLTPGAFPPAAPSNVVVAGANIFFVAESAAHGRELWVSNGVVGDARLVRDIRPGGDSPLINMIVAVGNRVVFLADDGLHGYEWWTSDGTEPGTTMLLDLNPGPAHGAAATRPVTVGGRVYLTADDGLSGGELYTTSGAPGDLRLVTNIAPGAAGSFPNGFVALPDGRVVFAATDGVSGIEPWVSDGTATGTVQLADLWPGLPASHPREFAATSNGVFFAAALNVPPHGLGLYFTDGTAAGTHLVAPAGFFVAGLTGSGTRAYFYSSTPNGQAPFVSDGTAAGTLPLLAVDGNVPFPLIAPRPNGGAVFAALAGGVGVEPWLTDGAPSSTRLARDIENTRGTGDAQPALVGAIGGRALFTASDGTSRSLYATDGSARGTVRLHAAGSNSLPYCRLSRAVLFADGSPQQLVATDGTSAGTQVLGPAISRADSDCLLDPDHAVFPGANQHLSVTDGTPAGTRLVANVPALDFASAGNGTVFFVGYEQASRYEVWRTDGTAAGTSLIVDLQPQSESQPPDLLGTVDGKVVFAANDGTGRAVWVSDGTAAGTQLLVRTTTFFQGQGARAGDRLVFSVGPGVHATDGTPNGTVRILATPWTAAVATLGTGVVILESDALAGRVWRSDGTPAGTILIPYALPALNLPRLTPVSETQTAFAVPESQAVGALMVTDGTAAGTRRVAQFEISNGLPLTTVQGADGLVFYADSQPSTGRELYAAELGAAALREGHGCGASGFGLALTSTEPRLGRTLTVAAPNRLAASALALGVPAPLPTVVGGRCALWLDVAQPVVLAPMLQGGFAALPLPGSNNLLGVRVLLQAFAGPSGGPLGVDVSNGLRLVLGY